MGSPHCPLPESLAATNLLAVSRVSLFWISHINGVHTVCGLSHSLTFFSPDTSPDPAATAVSFTSSNVFEVHPSYSRTALQSFLWLSHRAGDSFADLEKRVDVCKPGKQRGREGILAKAWKHETTGSLLGTSWRSGWSEGCGAGKDETWKVEGA